MLCKDTFFIYKSTKFSRCESNNCFSSRLLCASDFLLQNFDRFAYQRNLYIFICLSFFQFQIVLFFHKLFKWIKKMLKKIEFCCNVEIMCEFFFYSKFVQYENEVCLFWMVCVCMCLCVRWRRCLYLNFFIFFAGYWYRYNSFGTAR